MSEACNKKYQEKTCCLEKYHEGYCKDDKGFKFCRYEGKDYPDHLGNGPDRYPMNNPAFDKAVAEVIEKRKADAERAKEFLRKLRKALREKSEE